MQENRTEMNTFKINDEVGLTKEGEIMWLYANQSWKNTRYKPIKPFLKVRDVRR